MHLRFFVFPQELQSEEGTAREGLRAGRDRLHPTPALNTARLAEHHRRALGCDTSRNKPAHCLSSASQTLQRRDVPHWVVLNVLLEDVSLTSGITGLGGM